MNKSKKKKIYLVLFVLLASIVIIKPMLCPYSNEYGVHTVDECEDYHDTGINTKDGGGHWTD